MEFFKFDKNKNYTIQFLPPFDENTYDSSMRSLWKLYSIPTFESKYYFKCKSYDQCYKPEECEFCDFLYESLYLKEIEESFLAV